MKMVKPLLAVGLLHPCHAPCCVDGSFSSDFIDRLMAADWRSCISFTSSWNALASSRFCPASPVSLIYT